MVALAAIVAILAGVGATRLLADSPANWAWLAVAALVSAGGVWAGVPETAPALLAAGGMAGLIAAARLTAARWAPTAGLGLGLILGWAALTGAAGRPWAALGGALCSGVAPWFALPRRSPNRGNSLGARPWLLGAHASIVFVAARWIGVDPAPGWGRVAIVIFAGVLVACAARRQA